MNEILISGFIYFLFLQVVCFAVSKRPISVYEAADKDVRDLRYWCFRRKGKLRFVFDKDILLLSIVCAMIWVCLIDYKTLVAFTNDIIGSAHAIMLMTGAPPPPKRYDGTNKVLFLLLGVVIILWGYLYWFNRTKSALK